MAFVLVKREKIIGNMVKYSNFIFGALLVTSLVFSWLGGFTEETLGPANLLLKENFQL